MRMTMRCALGVVALLAAAALASCHSLQKQALPGPPGFTVRAAPGAPGVPRETASEFIHRAPFPPASKALVHEGLCYAEPFFHDPAVDPAGRDTDRYSGVDTAHLFFSATCGTPETWLAMPNGRDPVKCAQSASETHAVDPFRMILGNGTGIGDGMRYFWQCASNVLAHGPRQCPAPAPEFGCPEGFDGTQDTVLARNAYERWGFILGPGLRMVCGFSTAAFCHPDDARRVWELYDRASNGYGVADAFIEGFRRGREGTVPLCITRGGADVERTALFDEEFVLSPGPFVTSHYHAQYPAAFRSTRPAERPDESGLPQWAPIYSLRPMPLPPALKPLSYETLGGSLLSRDLEGATGLVVRVRPESGAVHLIGRTRFERADRPLREDEYLERADRFLREMGLAEPDGKPEGIRMVLESVPVVNRTYEVARSQKGVILLFRRQIDLDGRSVPVLGDGGLIRVVLNNDGSVARAAKTWREIAGVRKIARVKPFDTAYREAQRQLADPGRYRLDGWAWGYREHGEGEQQADLKVVQVFYFAPRAGDAGPDAAHRRIEIDAHLDVAEATIDR
ncbi:MAG: hypothetical protein A4E67_02530 [Syntrophaceae bacterium PtaB.Bin038]|nr:MAG: hypothetical protein A4E67_02530 [Syntrophaceae bacterium PtaB.Bin038]